MINLQKELIKMNESVPENFKKIIVEQNKAQSDKIADIIDETLKSTLKSELSDYSDKVSACENKQIKSTIKSEIQSYSTALKHDLQGKSKPPQTIKSIQSAVKKVVKDALHDNDRSNSVVIFGIKEDINKSSTEYIKCILDELELKPRLKSVTRIGHINEQFSRPWPIRVTFENSETVHDVLKNSNRLRHFDDFKNIYVSIDRNKKQQETYRALVQKLKTKITSDPTKHWSIKGGKIMCEEQQDCTHN